MERHLLPIIPIQPGVPVGNTLCVLLFTDQTKQFQVWPCAIRARYYIFNHKRVLATANDFGVEICD